MRLVRLSYLAGYPQAILDGRQPIDLTAEKLLEHSPFCHVPGTISRIVLGFA